MKKIRVILLAAILVCSFTACNVAVQTDAQEDSSAEVVLEDVVPLSETITEAETDGGQKIEPLPAESEETEKESAEMEKVYVADAAMYRGTVVTIEDTESGKRVTLEQAKGTDFGASSVQIDFTENTRTSFSADELKEGAYLEVFYGVVMGMPTDFSVPLKAVGANLYPSAEMVVFNGIVKEILPDEEEEGKGRLLMEDMENGGQEVVFLYDRENTQFYLDFGSLQKGDKLNFLHRGAMTRSLPPQGFLYEARIYREPEDSGAL